jgi:hypothetical protein
MSEMIKRRDATKRTLERFRGVTFDWSSGVTCVHLAHAHLVEMGHNPPDIPEFNTAHGAAKALYERGWSDVADMLDSVLERRPGAAWMVLGDLALVKGADGLDAIFICAGPLKVFGWRDDEPELVLLDVGLDELEAAWKV